MINIFKSDLTQYVYIQGVEHSFAEDFEYTRNGNLFTIKTKYTDVVQICEVNYREFTGKDSFLNDITFIDADEFENYLLNIFVQVPIVVIYGSELNIFRNDNVIINNTSTQQDVIDSNTTSLSTGTYEIDITYGWNHNSTQHDFESYFLFDGVALGVNTSGLIHKQEPKDAAGNFSGTGSLQQYTFCKKFIVDVTSVGIKSVKLSFNTSTTGCQASIFETIIKLKRIA